MIEVGDIAEIRREQAQLLSELGSQVRKAVELLLVARSPALEAAWGKVEKQAVYAAACRWIMRVVVVLFAEGRGLLPRQGSNYHRMYGIRGLLEALDRQSSTGRRSRDQAWSRLRGLFSLLYRGAVGLELTMTAYGGDLFRPGDKGGQPISQALWLLESAHAAPDDQVIHQLLVLLSRRDVRVRNGRGWRRLSESVDFAALPSETIGTLYEGLLDFELHRVDGDPVIILNLNDQPALPIGHLEQMTDRAIRALVSRAKGNKGRRSRVLAEPSSDGRAGHDKEVGGQDLRGAAVRRAMQWALRAVRVGKLVVKGRRGDNSGQEEQQQRAAEALVSGLRLPGALYLARWGGARKGSGSFYTGPQLTMPTVRRTLLPLTHEGDQVRAPEKILKLLVVDPAMGSASFLLAALRVLTRAAIEGAYIYGRIRREGEGTRVQISTLAEDDQFVPFVEHDPRFAEALEFRIKRYVAQNCLYGVDMNPLAVELARMALWIETADGRLPFSFFDHQLKLGNSLVGCWFDRFREYPLLAWSRVSPDKGYRGVNHPFECWHRSLLAKRKAVISEQAELLRGHASGATMCELKVVCERFAELREAPADRSVERARVERLRMKNQPALDRLRVAFDTWTALWFWPLDRLDAAPGPRTLHEPKPEAVEIVRQLVHRPGLRFFHWEIEFPEVFCTKGGGFDAVIGNPPWEIQKPSSKEYFSSIDPLYRSYGKQEALLRQRQIFEERPAEEERWLLYVGGHKAQANFVRHAGEPFGDGGIDRIDKSDVTIGHGGGHIALARGEKGDSLHAHWRQQRRQHQGFADPRHPFCHQGSADLNTYKMFVEVGHALLREGGELGLIVPSGIYTDKGCADLRRLVLERSRWRWLFGFDNRGKIFEIHRSFKFCVLIVQKGGQAEAVQAAFMRHDLEDWVAAEGADYVLDVPVARVKAFSPKSLSILEIRCQRDLQVLRKIYEHGVLLGDTSAEGWGIRYATELHMTNDSKLFPARERWQAKGYRVDADGRWSGPGGRVALPLYEGRMIGQFDLSAKGWVRGRGRTALWRSQPWPAKTIEPQFLIAQSDYQAKRPDDHATDKVAFMDVTAATNQRTMIAVALCNLPCGNSAPVLRSRDSIGLAALLNSFCYDYVARQRCGGLHLNYFVIEETPLVQRYAITEPLRVLSASLMGGGGGAQEWLRRRLQLPCGGWALTTHERVRQRAVLDSVIAALYGLDRADFAWILRDCDHAQARLLERRFTRTLDPKGFWRVDRHRPPELRHTVLSLVAFDALMGCVRSMGGDLAAGIQLFTGQHDGDGWLLPRALCLADYQLGHDRRAQVPQPVASALGPRFVQSRR